MNQRIPAQSIGLALAAAAVISAPSIAQQHDDFDSYPAATSVVGLGGWEEWGPGAGASTSSAQVVSPGNSLDIQGGADVVQQYSGYTSGRWVFTAQQYVPTGLTAKSYFIMLSTYGATNAWSVQAGPNPATGMFEADAGGGQATTPILYDQWVELKVVIDLDADWTQLYYNGTLLDSATVPDHPVLGGGWTWTGGVSGNYNGPLSIGALDLYANNASSVYYDEISLQPETSWRDDLDTYAANTSLVNVGGWEEWGAGAGANASNAQSYGPGNSIDIQAAADLVHRYSGYTSGRWEYSAKQYVPSGLTAKSYFIILSSYGTTNVWAVQVGANPATGNVEADAGGGQATTPIVYDQWVDIQVMIDLDADWVQLYYNGILLDSSAVADHPVFGGGWSWTGGALGTSAGPLDIGAVDLFANGATSVYYDELSLRPAKKGIRAFGDATTGSNGDCQIYALDDAVAPNANFGIGCRRAPRGNTAGALALTINSFPSGFNYAGIELLVDPVPALITLNASADATGGSTFAAPLTAAMVGWTLYWQYIWLDSTSTGPLSASNGLETFIH